MAVEGMAAYMAARRERRRGELLNLAGNKCARCDSQELLEFNHLDRTTKLFSLSGAGLDKAWDRVLAEFAKCELLCRSCHREYTDHQFASGDIRTWNADRNLPYAHGTARMYNEKRCRCEPCRIAKSKYRNGLIGYNDVA